MSACMDEDLPQRLKPRCRRCTYDTAEAVPLNKQDLIRGSLLKTL